MKRTKAPRRSLALFLATLCVIVTGVCQHATADEPMSLFHIGKTAGDWERLGSTVGSWENFTATCSITRTFEVKLELTVDIDGVKLFEFLKVSLGVVGYTETRTLEASLPINLGEEVEFYFKPVYADNECFIGKMSAGYISTLSGVHYAYVLRDSSGKLIRDTRYEGTSPPAAETVYSSDESVTPPESAAQGAYSTDRFAAYPRTERTSEYEPVRENGTLIINTNLANVREEPNRWIEDAWFMEVPRGQRFAYYEKVQNKISGEWWYRIILDGLNVGFVHYNIVIPTPEN